MIYGTAYFGGANSCGSTNCGTVFALTPSTTRPWSETIIRSFNGSDGQAPNAGVTFNSSGSLFGTTVIGGSGGGGTVFQLTPPTAPGDPWNDTTLYSFTLGNSPNTPYGSVLVGETGAIFGTTFVSNISSGGGKSGGAVFMLTPPSSPGGSWTESTLLNFWLSGVGVSPYAGVIAANGYLYGTNYYSYDANGCGLAY
jgi:uncharacterized repeat protein (TIGR03803 family)